MLSRSGDDFAISHDSDPLGDDVLATVGRHLDVHLPSVTLKVGRHSRASIVTLDVADFSFLGVYGPGELVDVASGLGKVLVSGGGTASHRGDETVCDGMRSVSEVVVLQAEDGFSRAR